MPNSWFRFKQFKVEQSGAAMKVGTDGVLLGAWLRVDSSFGRYLDVGTGTGVISLMVAQRVAALPDGGCSAKIDAVEVDADAAAQARKNVEASPWADTVAVHTVSLQEFAEQTDAANSRSYSFEEQESVRGKDSELKYDHIFSNPPWFVDDLQSPAEQRNIARHAVGLTYGELLGCVAVLLKEDGVLSVVLPAANGRKFEEEAFLHGMTAVRRTLVRTLPNATPKRVLIELKRIKAALQSVAEDELTIETATPGCYSEEYRSLTKDFYLKF